jgi:hypothetical protein
VPSFESERIHGSSNLKTIPDGWRVLKTIFSERLSTPTPVAARQAAYALARRARTAVVGPVTAFANQQAPAPVFAELAIRAAGPRRGSLAID